MEIWPSSVSTTARAASRLPARASSTVLRSSASFLSETARNWARIGRVRSSGSFASSSANSKGTRGSAAS